MADRGGKRKRRGRKNPGGEQRANLIKAIDHPLRRCVLRVLLDEDEPRSPTEIKQVLGLKLNSVAYHVRILLRLGGVKPAGEQMVRGAMEHFYRPAIENDPPIETLLEETREFDEEAIGL
jgi:DNA-binding transcriptional ArsR family regulator